MTHPDQGNRGISNYKGHPLLAIPLTAGLLVSVFALATTTDSGESQDQELAASTVVAPNSEIRSFGGADMDAAIHSIWRRRDDASGWYDAFEMDTGKRFLVVIDDNPATDALYTGQQRDANSNRVFVGEMTFPDERSEALMAAIPDTHINAVVIRPIAYGDPSLIERPDAALHVTVPGTDLHVVINTSHVSEIKPVLLNASYGVHEGKVFDEAGWQEFQVAQASVGATPNSP